MDFVSFMKFRQWIIGLCLLCLCSSVTFAQTVEPSDTQEQPPAPVYTQKEFFTVDEDNLESATKADSDYAKVMAFSPMFTADQFVQAVKVLVVNLLRWTLHNELVQEPTERYMRKLHFGRWINDPTDDTCMNTRARVLVRDNVGDLTFRNGKQCIVDTGLWNDPYAGKQVTTSKEIQIDHMVPLKNAYMSGAWQWDYKTRCLYANYTGFKDHLVSSDAHENMSKGDRAPDKYIPPNLAYRCTYLKNWLAVKLIWGLNMTPNEVQAIHQTVVNYNCNPKDFRFTKQELENQRNNINDNLEFCMQNR